MDDNNSSQNNHFAETNYLQQSTAAVIHPRHEHTSNINYNTVNVELPIMNDNSNFSHHTNINHFNQQLASNNSYPQITSDHAPPQPIENTSSPFDSFNMTNVNPSQTEIFSFDIPGFKIIIIPTFSQQDNNSLNYSSTQFTQNRQ
ncbi:hypothetical protein RclHR1_10900004 [Rhizophagus clarus]|uniref:Uncharacterized protein n=1 Tax=Rhizophagus clarus TaxID=94130 RepID=A0A2Z6QVQ4_9GLOM|nr:hypothetical protein RclHR1_10900004 [Rhizophagus clarus]GET04097.1 hypothetical protein GLOIN_2v1769689 [Rhizophagus clarus]